MTNSVFTRRTVAKTLASASAAACAGVSLSALAQTGSDKQTRIIVPSPPGAPHA